MRILVAILTLLICWYAKTWADFATLETDSLSYKEGLLIASGNVKLRYQQNEILCDTLHVDVDQELAWSTGNTVILKRGEDEVRTQYLFMNLKKETISIRDIQVSIPQDNGQKLYLSVKELTDEKGQIQYGSYAKFTSCSYQKPDHFFWAYKFRYLPDKRIELYGGILYDEFLFIPIYIPVPFYMYHLGKRKVVWNFPTIGKKNTPGWGWFIQNTIDYDRVDNRDSSFLLDYYEFKGIGLGLRHQYQINQHSGTLYGYRFDFQDKGLQKTNQSLAWDNQYKINENWTLSHGYSQFNTAERIQESGPYQVLSKKIGVSYQDEDALYTLGLSESEDFIQKFKNLSLSGNHTQEKQRQYGFSFNQNTYMENNIRLSNLNLDHRLELPFDMILKNDIRFDRQEWFKGSASDDALRSSTTLSKAFGPSFNMQLKIEEFWDLDEDRVTTDSNSNLNDFLYKVPELDMTYTTIPFPQYENLSFTQKTIVARYQEVKYESFKTRIFPESQDFSLDPNFLQLSPYLSYKKTDLPKQGQFFSTVSYYQYLFKSPGKSLFEGDAQYTTELSAQYLVTPLPFLKSETTYLTRGAPKENNSPFFSFQQQVQVSQYTGQRLHFFIHDFNQYRFTNISGYDFVNQRFDDYIGQITLVPTASLSLFFESGKILSPRNENEAKNSLKPFKMEVTLSPSKKLQMAYLYCIDLNHYFNDNKITVLDSALKGQMLLGTDPAYEWSIGFKFGYDTLRQGRTFDLGLYTLQTLEITKKQHERILSFKYDKTLDEVKVIYTFLIFPDDPIQWVKQGNNSRFEGKLNKQAEQR